MGLSIRCLGFHSSPRAWSRQGRSFDCQEERPSGSEAKQPWQLTWSQVGLIWTYTVLFFFLSTTLKKNHNIFQSTYRELTPVYWLPRWITEFYNYDWRSLQTPTSVTLSSRPCSNLETSVVNDPKFIFFLKQRTPQDKLYYLKVK